jgi:transposase
MEQHLIEDAVWQRMLAALETVPYMHCRDLDRLRCFISACFVVMRTDLTWAELGGLVPSAETSKKRFRRWAKKGVFNRLMECSQLIAAPDVLHIDSTSIKCHRTTAGARGGGDECIGRSRGGLTTKAHHAVDGLGFIRRQLTSPGQQGDCTKAEALTAGLQLSGDTGEPAAGDIWHPSTWGRVSPRLGKHHKGLKKKGGGRVDGFSCRYWPAPRMSPDTATLGGGRQRLRQRQGARALAWTRHRRLHPAQAQPHRAALVRQGPISHPAPRRDLPSMMRPKGEWRLQGGLRHGGGDGVSGRSRPRRLG